MPRFLLTIGSFAVIMGMYVLYDRLAVPMLLPERTSRVFEDPDGDGQREELEPYLSLFAEGDWERDPKKSVQKLEIDQTIILFCNDEVNGNIVKLKPCTILFLDKNPELSEAERIRQAFVMRTPQYAEVEFDGEVNFSSFPLPKIKGGTLLGQVSIHSDMKEPGPNDDFHLDTENVVFVESPALTKISTLKDVAFRWGTTIGKGSVLQIDLAKLDPKNKNSSKEFSRLKFDSLPHLHMLLADKEGSAVAATAPKTANLVPSLPPNNVADPTKTTTMLLREATTLDIQCKREFVFESGTRRGDWVACFFGDVKAVRTNPDGTADQIDSDELQVHFSPKPQDPKAKTATPKSGNVAGLGAMEPALLMARGKMGIGNQPPVPARLTSKQNGGVLMIGDQILYDLVKNQLILETEKIAGASKEVFLALQNSRYVFKSTQGFFYTMPPNGGIGLLTSPSPGNFQGMVGEGNQLKKVSATWNTLRMEPYKSDPRQVVVQMGKGVRFDMQGLGWLTADRFDLWCFVSQGAAASPPAQTPDGSLFSGIGTLTPDCAKVLGNVHFENQDGICDVNQLDIRFETVGPDGKIISSQRTPQLPPLRPLIPSGEPRVGPPEIEKTYKTLTLSQREKGQSPALHPPPSTPYSVIQVQHREQRSFEAPPQPRPAVVQPATANQGQITPLVPITVPVPSPQPTVNSTAPKLESGGLFGLRSGASRSVYAITADRMRMLVRNEAERSELSVIHLDGNVRITEKLTGVPTGEAVEILGEEVKVWNPSAPNTQILIKGKPPRDAEFRGKGAKLNAMEINISRAENQIWSKGAGRLLVSVPAQGSAKSELIPLTPLGGTPQGGDNRLLVDWSEKMFFDGKTIVFQGVTDQSGIRVLAYYQNTRIIADIIKVHLNRVVSFFDDQSDIQAKAETIECVNNVFIQTEEIENNRHQSVSTALFNGLSVRVETGDFIADGPGEIRRTFVNDGKGFSMPGGSSPRETPNTKEQLAHLFIRFHKELRGNYLTHIAEIEGTVRCMYCPTNLWDMKLSDADQNSVVKRGYLMNCDHLLIVQMPNPGGNTQSVELTATGRTTIEGTKDLFARAETIKYNQAKGQVILEGNAFGKAIIHAGKNQASATKLEYNTETGNFQVVEGDGFEFSR